MNQIHKDALEGIKKRGRLGPVEQGFIDRLSNLPPDAVLTPKRAKWLEDIARRLGVIQ